MKTTSKYQKFPAARATFSGVIAPFELPAIPSAIARLTVFHCKSQVSRNKMTLSYRYSQGWLYLCPGYTCTYSQADFSNPLFREIEASAIPVGIASYTNLAIPEPSLFCEIEASAIPVGIANGNFPSRNP